MIRAIIFDLDNCLAAADEVPEVLEPVLEVLRNAFSGQQLESIVFDLWRHPLDWVAQKHGFLPEVQQAVWEVYRSLELPRPMRGYPDVGLLSSFLVQRFLVTSGFRKFQESKIKSLGLDKLCTVFVDAIDELNRKGKQMIFAEILTQNNFIPSEVLVVGDNPHSELEAGNNLGIPTVQTLRPGVPRATNASFYVEGLAELKNLLEGL